VGPASDGVTQGLTTFGAAGVMKVPHAVTMHAVQVLPGLAWLLGFAAVGERRRLGLVWAATKGLWGAGGGQPGPDRRQLGPAGCGRGRGGAVPARVLLVGAAFAATLLALRHSTPASRGNVATRA
jgi:hypothetical protein